MGCVVKAIPTFTSEQRTATFTHVEEKALELYRALVPRPADEPDGGFGRAEARVAIDSLLRAGTQCNAPKPPVRIRPARRRINGTVKYAWHEVLEIDGDYDEALRRVDRVPLTLDPRSEARWARPRVA